MPTQSQSPRIGGAVAGSDGIALMLVPACGSELTILHVAAAESGGLDTSTTPMPATTVAQVSRPKVGITVRDRAAIVRLGVSL